jgi:hypothetical protein
MSTELIARSPDLLRLRDEGYNIAVIDGHLAMREVPYVNAAREVRRGTLVSVIDVASDKTVRPRTHVVLFAGEYPCDQHGQPIEGIRHSATDQTFGDVRVLHSFSNKPAGGYEDYYAKMSRYAAIISAPAAALDPDATPKTFPPLPAADDESPFKYLDTASSRAGISEVSHKLRLKRVAIIGLGGTGSYVLDLVAKTPVAEIHLFDRDAFLNHNAFRAPGAASFEDLERRPSKVEYLTEKYSVMRSGICPHKTYVSGENASELQGMDFVFVCVDRSEVKKVIFEALMGYGVPFIDVGMGVTLVDGMLRGTLRATAATGDRQEHLSRHVSFVDNNEGAAYEQNIQIADLNMLNAALAVLKWKKMFGFYHDEHEAMQTTYSIAGNSIMNAEKACD